MSDPRFSRLKSDPRFRRPKKKQQKVVIDERFKSVFDHKGKGKGKPLTDKYGRRLLKSHEENNLKRYYRLAPGSGDEGENEKNDDQNAEAKPQTVDYARGELLMESSDEDNDQKEEPGDFEDSDAEDIVRVGGEDEELEIDLDEDTYAELDAQVAAYTKANEELEQQEDIGIANRTRRLAVVNLDWDQVRASHLYKIFSSLVSLTAPHVPITAVSTTRNEFGAKKGKGGASSVARGAILSVKVYPSDFGKARMEREEKEGPPAEIFKKRRRQPLEINEKTIYEVGDEDEYDEDALRRYQLERLRYYFAIVECDTAEAASHIYNELDGTELERSANVFDLSFVPDDMSFEADPRDEANEDLSTDYKPLDFVTDALRHSKVKLTWDEDDPERYQLTRRQLTRQEIEESDFRAYIATSSEEEDEVEAKNALGNRKNKDATRQRLRALLLGGNDDAMPEGWSKEIDGSDVDMEITFTPGLSEKTDEQNVTTLERYQMKVRDKRKKRKEERKESTKSKGIIDGKGLLQGDEFFKSESSGEDESDEDVQRDASTFEGENKRRSQKMTPQKKSTAEELTLVASSQSFAGQEPKHFDMKAVLKAERRKGRKGNKNKKSAGEDELQENFQIDVNDDRFKALHEDHQFAIDPTNPRFQKTKGMKAFLEERQRRQKGARDDIPAAIRSQVSNSYDRGLESLIENVKRKSQDSRGNSKRRRI